jgi:hypothetical protein
LYKLFVEDSGALNDENVDPDKSNDRFHINNSYQPLDADNHDQSFQSPDLGDKRAAELSPEVSGKTRKNLDSVSHIMTRKSKSTYQREWYKRLTPEQKKARNQREKMAWLEGKRVQKKTK